jgi:hypothetical protein
VSIRNLGVGISFKGGNEGDPPNEGSSEVTELGAVDELARAPRESEESVSVSVGEKRSDIAALGEEQVVVEVGDNGWEGGEARKVFRSTCPVMTLVQRHGENSLFLLVD